MVKQIESQLDDNPELLFTKPSSKPKHRRNKSIFTSSNNNSLEREDEEVSQKVIETMRKVHAQPHQTKVQVVDDFSEDINVLAEKVAHEHQKEAFRKSLEFSTSHHEFRQAVQCVQQLKQPTTRRVLERLRVGRPTS